METVSTITRSQRLEAIKNTIIWGGFNTLFGICPVLLLLGISRLPLRPEVCLLARAGYAKLIDDGSIIFFFLAMIGSSTIDVYIGRKKFAGNFAWFMFISGSMSISAIIFLYLVFLFGGDAKHALGKATGIFRCASIVTLAFCTTAKYQLTLKELHKHREDQL